MDIKEIQRRILKRIASETEWPQDSNNARLILIQTAYEKGWWPMKHIKLAYIGKMKGFEVVDDVRLWNVLEPQLQGYNYTDPDGTISYNVPTFGLQGLIEMKLIPNVKDPFYKSKGD